MPTEAVKKGKRCVEEMFREHMTARGKECQGVQFHWIDFIDGGQRTISFQVEHKGKRRIIQMTFTNEELQDCSKDEKGKQRTAQKISALCDEMSS